MSVYIPCDHNWDWKEYSCCYRKACTKCGKILMGETKPKPKIQASPIIEPKAPKIHTYNPVIHRPHRVQIPELNVSDARYYRKGIGTFMGLGRGFDRGMTGKSYVSAAPPSAHCDDSTHDGDGNAILLCEDFDGATECAATYTSNCRSAWSTNLTGTIDFDHNTAPSPLEGTYSLYLDSSSSSGHVYHGFSADGDMWFYAIVNIGTIAVPNWNDYHLIMLRDSGGTPVASVGVETYSGVYYWMAYSQGGTAVRGANNPVAGTTYHLWGHYVKGSGANATITLYVSSNATRGDVQATCADGTSTADAANVYLQAYSGELDLVNYDHVRVSGTEIGSDPP